MKIPEIPQRGQSVDASWAADVVRYLKALTARPSPTVKPSMGAGGTTYLAVPSGPRIKKPSSTNYPWQPLGSDGSGNQVFEPGMINNDVPAIGGTPMSDDPAPALAITTTGTVYVEMDVTAGDPDPSTAVLKNAAGTPSDTSSKAYVTIHYVTRTVDGSDVLLDWGVSRRTHLWMDICDGKTRVWQA